MTEYHSINGTCMPPLHGVWTQQADGYLMEIRTETGQLFQVNYTAIFHELSGENNEEMNMVLYGCRVRQSNGECQPGEQLISILSNSRHPQTMQLFKSAKHIEDFACTDILLLNKMDTYTNCGDSIVDEDQKLRHAKIWENDEFVDVECRAENFLQSAVSIGSFFDEPRILTVVAYIDPLLEDEQIAHVSCLYDSKTSAKCQWLRQRKCFSSDLSQDFDGNRIVKIKSKFTKINGEEIEIDLSGMVVWQNGDEYITLECLLIGDDGSCDQHRVYVWSDEDLMDQPTIREIYRALQNFCVDPTDLIFLNTFHECDQMSTLPAESDIKCGPLRNWQPLNSSLLFGVWYVAADLNAHPKIFLQSAVIEFTPNPNATDEMSIRYYVQKEDGRECVGPGEGSVLILPDGTLSISVVYSYRVVKNHRNTLRFNLQILYLDNQRAVLYWCFKRAANGTCLQYDVDVLIRSRFFSHNDLSMIQPYLQKACVSNEQLRWFDLHAPCGYEMAQSTRLRRDMVTLSHSEVLDILTDVQEPQCEVRKIKGTRAPLQTLERAGTWFLMAQFDEMVRDTYAAVFRLHCVDQTHAVIRMHQSAALPGKSRECFERIITVEEFENDEDFYYEIKFEASSRNVTSMIFRFLFANPHVGVLYSCLDYKDDGKCEENAIYVISRHESIDHAELAVLEQLSKAVCIEPDLFFHTATHDVCVYEHPRLLRPPSCSKESDTPPEGFQKLVESIASNYYGNVRLYGVASNLVLVRPFSMVYKSGSTFTRTIEMQHKCVVDDVDVIVSPTNPYIFLIEKTNETILTDPAGRQDDLVLKKAQLSCATLPCLYPIQINETTCKNVVQPKCASSSPLSAAEELLGRWSLYASNPYVVANSKCTVRHDGDKDGVYLFSCTSESWRGECERDEKFRFSVDAWGGYKFESVSTAVHENFEIFSRGNVSLTPQRLLFFQDSVGIKDRRWSVWVRTSPRPAKLTIPEDLSHFCVWPTVPQMHSMELIC